MGPTLDLKTSVMIGLQCALKSNWMRLTKLWLELSDFHKYNDNDD